MIIVYRPSVGNTVDPLVVVDYTRSDDQYTQTDITRYVNMLGLQAASGKTINIANLQVYSLDYSMSFTHTGISYGDALKTRFTCSIQNAPIDLVSLLNIQYYVSQQNIDSLQGALSDIIDPQVFFPTGAFVIKPNSNTNTETITRTFMIYSVQNNGDQRRINNNLVIKGSSFDSMVMRLQTAVDISKSSPLISQLQAVFSSSGYKITYEEPSLASITPRFDRYYPPAPINSIMKDICRDNQIAFDMDSDTQTITIMSLSSPHNTLFETSLCFWNYVLGAKLVSTFVLQDYASCIFESEAFDVDLYESVVLYDDSFNDGQFFNLKKTAPYISSAGPLDGYRFYVLEYTYFDSRIKTSITVRGTNNWLLSNFRLDNFLENKVYSGAV